MAAACQMPSNNRATILPPFLQIPAVCLCELSHIRSMLYFRAWQGYNCKNPYLKSLMKLLTIACVSICNALIIAVTDPSYLMKGRKPAEEEIGFM